MGSSEGHRSWSVFDGGKVTTSSPESLMSEINTAIANLEYARATTLLDPTSSSIAKNTSSDNSVRLSPQYDPRKAGEAYKAGCLALASGKLDEALQSLNIALSNCRLIRPLQLPSFSLSFPSLLSNFRTLPNELVGTFPGLRLCPPTVSLINVLNRV